MNANGAAAAAAGLLSLPPVAAGANGVGVAVDAPKPNGLGVVPPAAAGDAAADAPKSNGLRDAAPAAGRPKEVPGLLLRPRCAADADVSPKLKELRLISSKASADLSPADSSSMAMLVLLISCERASTLWQPASCSRVPFSARSAFTVVSRAALR